MPIINFEPEDILRQKLLDEGWYGAKITSITGPVAAKTGKGVNFEFDFTLDEKTPAPGKVITKVFNSNAIGLMLPLIAAVRNVPLQSIVDNAHQFSLNTDELLNTQVDVKLIRDQYQGMWNNKPDGYLPYGQGTNQAVPF